MESRSFANWSLHLIDIFGLEVRIHWSWFLLPAFAIMLALGNGIAWWWYPLLVVVPFLSVLFHEFGHSFMARLVGGESRQIIMWAFGGLALCEVPSTPGKRFAVAAAGPMVSFVIYALGALLAGQGPLPSLNLAQGQMALVVSYLTMLNLGLLLFNLLPAHPLDGGAMLRAALWPVFGVRRAVYATILVAYVVILALLVGSVLTRDLYLLAISLLMLGLVVQEHVAFHRGYDPYMGSTDDLGTGGQPWFESWKERRRERRREREDRTAAAEQELLDRLLAKVSEKGLTALTEQERTTLQRISKRQRDRQTTGG
jgi:Zn-dependent protease